MDAVLEFLVTSYTRLAELTGEYSAIGEGRAGLSLILWLPIVPLLFLNLGLGVYIKRPFAALSLALMGEALLGAPLLGGDVGDGNALLFSLLRLLSWILPGALGWFLPRVCAPFAIGYFASLTLNFAGGDVVLSVVVWGALALTGIIFWRWSYPHMSALGSARLLAFLVFESETPLALPTPLPESYRVPTAWLFTILLCTVGIYVQLNQERKRDLV